MTSNLVNTPEKLHEITSVFEIYSYLDSLFDQDVDADILFASGYLRGFIGLEATQFGDEQQVITTDLLDAVSVKLKQAKSELTPQDAMIVNNFWLKLQGLCSVKS